MRELLDYTERRTRAELAALPHGVYEAEGVVDNDGYTDEPVRLRARVEIGADGASLRHDRLRPAAARARQLDLREDVLGLRVRAQVPDRPRPAGQRRLLPAHPGRRARGDGDELHLAGPGRRRLGDADAPRRGDLPGAPAGVPRPASGGDEGDDVPGRLRLARRRARELLVLLRHVRRRLRRAARERRPRRGAGARAEHRERADRGDGAQLPGADRAPRRSSRTPRARAASAAGSGCARTTASTSRRRSRSSPTATARAVGRGRRRRRPRGGVRARPRRRRDAARARRRRSTSSRAT